MFFRPSAPVKNCIVSLEDISSPKQTTLIPQTPQTLPKTSSSFENGEADTQDEKTSDDSIDNTLDDVEQEEMLPLEQKGDLHSLFLLAQGLLM